MPNIISNEANLSKLLSDAYTSTLNAELQGQKQHLEILNQIKDLPPFSFSFTDENGNKTVLQVPVITLIPLSMLHIEEAEFNYSVSLSYNSTSQSETPILDKGIPNFTKAFIYNNGATKMINNRKVYEGEYTELEEIEIFLPITGSQIPIFKIIEIGGEPVYYHSKISNVKQKIKLLSFGRPHVALWELKNPDLTKYKFLIRFQLSGVVEYENKKYIQDNKGEKTIEIKKEIFNNRDGKRFALKKHIAREFLHRSQYTEINKSNTNFMVTLDNENQMNTNLTVKVKLKQSSIPTGMYEILQTAGNNIKIIQGR